MDKDAFISSLRPALEDVEKIRLEKLSDYERRKALLSVIAWRIFFVCAGLGILIKFIFHGADLTMIVILGGLCWGAFFWWSDIPRHEYKAHYKNVIIPLIAEIVGGLSYQAHGMLNPDDLRGAPIVPDFDFSVVGDCFSGAHNGASYRFFQARLIDQRQSGGKDSSVISFNGFIVLIQLEKRRFHGQTVMLRDYGKLFSWLREKFSGLQRAGLVDPDFEKIFDVYTNDQVEARYLMDPQIVEKIKTIDEIYKGISMSASYSEQRLVIMIVSDKKYFDAPGITQPAVNPDTVFALRANIEAIKGLIDVLDVG